MKFKSSQDVLDTINAGQDVRLIRSENRAKVNRAANGEPPLSDDEAASTGVKVNTNFLEQSELHLQARSQYLTGFYHSQRFFTQQFVDDCDVPKHKRASWEAFITRKLNRIMRKSREYFALHDNRFASVVGHGIGPCGWFDKTEWLPQYIAIEDLYVPTDTKCDFTNLEWFAVRWNYTEGELAKKAFGPNALKAWKKKEVAKILKEYHPDNYETTPDYNWIDNPEKAWELVKQNMGYFTSDAVPTIPLFHFFFKDKDGWNMRVLPDQGVKGDDIGEFLYDPSTDDNGMEIKERPFAAKLDHILHCQFGNLSNKAPFMYHAVRSLGFLLMEPCYWSNLMLCRLIQHTFEQFNVWLRATDANGKARAQMVNLFDKAFLPEGISIVPKEQRHSIDVQLVEIVMSRMKQLQSEKSAQYTQQADTGTKKEQTAFETSVKMQQVNAMTAALLVRAFIYETFLYEEICRRFCLKDSKDQDVLDFQNECKKFGIPAQYLNVELWDVQPEVPSGAGNPTMEMAKVQMLMQNRAQFPPQAQQEILQRFAILNTDPRTAERWVPLGKQGITDGQRDAEFSFGTLMAAGVPLNTREEYSPIEQIEVLLTLLAEMVDKAQKSGNMVDQKTLDGFGAVIDYTSQLIKQLAQRPDEKQKVKEFSQVLGKIQNIIKGFAQRLMEQQKKQAQGNGQPDPESVAKAQAIQQQNQLKLQGAAAKTKQQLQHKDRAFVSEQRRQNIRTVAEQKRLDAKAVGDAKRSRFIAMNEQHTS